MNRLAGTLRSITAKTDKQWRFLIGLWMGVGILVAIAPWNLGVGAILFAIFLHLGVTES